MQTYSCKHLIDKQYNVTWIWLHRVEAIDVLCVVGVAVFFSFCNANYDYQSGLELYAVTLYVEKMLLLVCFSF